MHGNVLYIFGRLLLALERRRWRVKYALTLLINPRQPNGRWLNGAWDGVRGGMWVGMGSCSESRPSDTTNRLSEAREGEVRTIITTRPGHRRVCV